MIAQLGHTDVVSVLLSYGCDLSRSVNAPSEIAREKGFHACAQVIEEARPLDERVAQAVLRRERYLLVEMAIAHNIPASIVLKVHKGHLGSRPRENNVMATQYTLLTILDQAAKTANPIW